MSLESVRLWLAQNAPDLEMIEVEESTATVETAAKALGVEPGHIAKTLAVRAGARVFLLVTRGDARLDNAKSKAEFGARPRMLGAEETLSLTSHPVGGVCPFGLETPCPIYRRSSACGRSTRFTPRGARSTSSVRSHAAAPVRLVGSAGSTCADCPTGLSWAPGFRAAQ